MSKEREPLGLTVIEENGETGEKDITVLHSKWDPAIVEIVVPSKRRMAIQWKAAHTYVSHDGCEVGQVIPLQIWETDTS